jgi:hypothetical protein
MKTNYQTGPDNNSIFLKVDVGTVGVAHTTVNQYAKGIPRKFIAESADVSGDIPNQVIGLSQNLRNSFVMVNIMIDFSAINSGSQEQAIANTLIHYELAGVSSASIGFTPDPDDIHFSADRTIMSILKQIQMG